MVRIYPTIRNAYTSGKTELQMELEFPASEDDDVSLAIKDGEGKELGRSKFVRAGSLSDKVVEFELDQDNQDEPIPSIGTINGKLGTQVNENWRVAARGKTSTLRRPPVWGAVTAAFRLKQLRNAKAKETPEEVPLSTPPRSPRESSSGSASARPPPARRFATVDSVESGTSEPLDTIFKESTAPKPNVAAAAAPALKPAALVVKEQAQPLGGTRNLKETVKGPVDKPVVAQPKTALTPTTKLLKVRAKPLDGTMKLKQTVKGPSEKRVVTQKDYVLKPESPKTLQKVSPADRPQTLPAKTLQKLGQKEKPGVKAKTLQKLGHKSTLGVVAPQTSPSVKAKTLLKPGHKEKPGVKAKTLQKLGHKSVVVRQALPTLQKPGQKEKPGVKAKTLQKLGHKSTLGVVAPQTSPSVKAKTLLKPGHKELPGVVKAKAPAVKTLKKPEPKEVTPVLFESEVFNPGSDPNAKATNGKFKVPTRRPRQPTIELKKAKKNVGLGTKTFALTTGDVQRRTTVTKSIVVKKVNKMAVEPAASQGLRSKVRHIFGR